MVIAKTNLHCQNCKRRSCIINIYNSWQSVSNIDIHEATRTYSHQLQFINILTLTKYVKFKIPRLQYSWIKRWCLFYRSYCTLSCSRDFAQNLWQVNACQSVDSWWDLTDQSGDFARCVILSSNENDFFSLRQGCGYFSGNLWQKMKIFNKMSIKKLEGRHYRTILGSISNWRAAPIDNKQYF